MTSYGGYAKPYGDNADGGGFMSGSQSASQGGAQGTKAYADSLRPVTIKQLLESEEAYPGASDFTIDGVVATGLTFVGQVRAVNTQPTNVTYRIDDGTGAIDVKKWLNADNADDTAAFAVDQFVRVFGRTKMFSQKRFVATHFMRAVDDYNEVSYHMLESTYVHLYLTRGTAGGDGAAAATHAHGPHGGDSMFVEQDAGYGAGGAGGGAFSANGQRVYNCLRTMSTGNEGVNINVITNELKMSYGLVMGAIQELVDKSVIFATVDDETFALM